MPWLKESSGLPTRQHYLNTRQNKNCLLHSKPQLTAVHLLQGAGHSTPGNWGRSSRHVKKQREQRTSSNMVSAKTMANGYQPTKGETWGEEPVAHTFDLAHSHTLPCSQQRPAPPPHMPLFLPFFSLARTRTHHPQSPQNHTQRHTLIRIYGPPRAGIPPTPPPPVCVASCV